MTNLTFADVRYRLITLRRITALGILLIAFGVWLAQVISGGGAFGALWPGVLVVSVALLVLHNVIYPAGWLEALGIPLAAVLSMAVYGAMSVTYAAAQPVMIFVAGLLFAVAVLVFVAMIAALHGKIVIGEIRNNVKVHMDVSARAYAEWAFERPGETHGSRRTGAIGADGLIPVWYDFRGPSEENSFDAQAPLAPINRTPDAYLRILERSETHQILQTVMPGVDAKGNPKMSMTYTTITPSGPASCLVTEREVHNLYDAVTYATAWLRDGKRDYYRDASDLIQGRPTPAIRRLPQDTLLAAVARHFGTHELSA